MTQWSGRRVVVFTIACLCLGTGSLAITKTQSPASASVQKEKKAIMTTQASGTFDVKMVPYPQDEKTGGSGVGKYSLEKQFHGDLLGTSSGEMLAVSTTIPESAGYVAMEQITGTLNGRKGTFALQHSGTMTRGTPLLSVTVVPDSGTGELAGLTGKMTIKIDAGKHFYEFEYTLPPTP